MLYARLMRTPAATRRDAQCYARFFAMLFPPHARKRTHASARRRYFLVSRGGTDVRLSAMLDCQASGALLLMLLLPMIAMPRFAVIMPELALFR